MKYQKARVQITNFGNTSFLVASGSEQSKADAINKGESAALSAYGGGNPRIKSSDAQYQGNGKWIVTVVVTNNGGQNAKTYEYDSVTGSIREI